jgi:antitoxin component YwqK of YwqJK toxin-antitoxin module
MKTLTLLFAASSLALTGCDNSNLDDPKTYQETVAEALGEDELETRQQGDEELLYRKDTQSPYTGWFVAKWDAQSIRVLAHYKDGSKDGPFFQYDEMLNEQLKGHYKNGKKDGPWIEWDQPWGTRKEGHYKNGKKDGLWDVLDEDGNESQVNYVDGEKVSP